jgi:NAD(P)-dependent dehydrogenase (short-subunit alcohol dehydrogenase family)
MYDKDDQQVDLRTQTSWTARMDQVSIVELMEVQVINAVAPFIINSKLKELMLRSGNEIEKYIINVSSMEGKFNRPHKDDRHPHTNMAKAALNMMTLSAAQDYAKSNIYMNAVDTGWITDEHPLAKLSEQGFQPPLDEVDGMARILHPVFEGIKGNIVYGLFLKDYAATSW